MSPLQELIAIMQLRQAQGGLSRPGYARGGYARGGLDMLKQAKQSRLVSGPGGGQDDNVPAMLSPGEYVWDADTVAAVGDGSNEEGARRLDELRERIRAHKRSAPASKIPPKAKKPEQYMRSIR